MLQTVEPRRTEASMRRLVYLCPETDGPVGGIKVIYRHVEALNRLGVPAFILHPHAPAFRYEWSEHAVPFLSSLTLSRFSDFIIVPEVLTLAFGAQCLQSGCPYAIFVQNGYLMHPVADEHDGILRDIVHGAHFVISIPPTPTGCCC